MKYVIKSASRVGNGVELRIVGPSGSETDYTFGLDITPAEIEKAIAERLKIAAERDEQDKFVASLVGLELNVK